MTLRPYQHDLAGDIRAAWAGGAQNVLARLDTGGGKTIVNSTLMGEHNGASCTFAHREPLVFQLSLSLAGAGLRHNVIASQSTRRAIAAEHLAVYGRSYYEPGARAAVASVDTLIRATGLEGWASQVTQWACDEGHHLVNDNKWHRAISMFTHPACRGLLWTATPSRADGKGLGRHTGGVADVMVQGPPMRWLIEEGYLTDYQVVCPTSDIVRLVGDVGASGDWSQAQLKKAAHESQIVGDVVRSYLQFARGKLGITFCTDVDTANATTAAYLAAGVTAATITGETDAGVRRAMLRRFAAREIMQLVAVDIISEGFDLPAVEVCSFGRITQSLALYMQQFGRALRPIYAAGFDLSTRAGRLAAIAASSKPWALIIDHVNNFLHHGPPDRPRPWSLGGMPRKPRGEVLSLRACANPACAKPYERAEPACPYCGAEPDPPAGRSSPAQVDGDLTLLDAATLARLRGEVETVDMSRDDYVAGLVAKGCPKIGLAANARRHGEQQEAQAALRSAMARWAGPVHRDGHGDRYIQRLFFLTFGVDVVSAQALSAADAETLRLRIET